ncbi:MAG: hypothetical protein AAGJ46_12290 [Planctomycetota bacterium]
MPEKDEFVLEAGRLKITFHWKVDRFEHRISAGNETRRAATKPEYLAPVFTEVHQQGELLFLSGHGPGCHWSASVEAEEQAFLFDVACRAGKEVGEIGSGYVGDGLLVEPAKDVGAIVLPGAQEVAGAPAWSIKPVASWSGFPGTLRYGYRISAGG